MSLLALTAVHKAFAGVRALKGVSFDLAAGEVHALVGENGAGKSTLIKIITGAERADAGSLVVAGRTIPLSGMNPATARGLGIVAIYQQPALFPHLTVAENIAFALEPHPRWRPIDWRARRAHAASLLARIGSALNPDRLVATLSMPEQQLVEIAKAVGADARIVVMDEPTASLSDREVTRLFDVIATLTAKGVGVLYISHRLDEVLAIAHRITVLRDGETVATGTRQSFTSSDLVRAMVGRELSTVFPKRPVTPGAIALEVSRVSSRSAGVHDVSLSVRHGEILGLAGLVGSGRTEFAEVLFGLRPLDAGEIRVNGSPVQIDSPAAADRVGIAYVPEDRRRHGVVLDMSVGANISLAVLPTVAHAGLIDAGLEGALAEDYARRLQIKTPSLDTAVATLSGGNQQKVSLARSLAANPVVLILDEPTQGVDVGAKAEIHALMQDLVDRGLAVLMISSDLPEILGMSDRIAVMKNGRVVGVFARAEATAEAVLTLAVGHAAPETVAP